MDELEQFIREHKEKLEEEAPRGHEARFRKRLNRAHRRSLYLTLRPVLRIAGVVLLFVLSGLWIIEHSGLLPRRDKQAGAYVYEYQETEQYYISLVNARLSSLETMHFLGDSTQKKILFSELSNMDSLYLDLQKELRMNPGDERLLQALTEYYEIKLDVINHIIRQLSALQTKKHQSHESKTM